MKEFNTSPNIYERPISTWKDAQLHWSPGKRKPNHSEMPLHTHQDGCKEASDKENRPISRRSYTTEAEMAWWLPQAPGGGGWGRLQGLAKVGRRELLGRCKASSNWIGVRFAQQCKFTKTH